MIDDLSRPTHEEGQTCETKPIGSRPEESVGQAPPYGRTQLRQTNPISSPASRQGGSQEAANPRNKANLVATVRNKANLRAWRGIGGASGTPNAICRVWEPDPPYKWAPARQTKPISGSRAVAGRSAAPNKANSADAIGRASAWRRRIYGELNMQEVSVKQSQSLDGGFRISDCGLGTVLRYAASSLPGPVVQPKPIGGANRAKQGQFRAAGPVGCAKQSQFPGRGRP